MSRKKGFDFSGIVMIAVFLGLYYGSENIDWFKTTDSTSRGIVLLICALILFLIVKTIFSIKNGFSKGVLIQNVILLVAAAAFIVVIAGCYRAGLIHRTLLRHWYTPVNVEMMMGMMRMCCMCMMMCAQNTGSSSIVI